MRYQTVRPGLAEQTDMDVVVDITGRKAMSLATILLIVLILMLIGAMPTWPHSRGWGYFPSGGLGLLVLILLILLVTGRL